MVIARMKIALSLSAMALVVSGCVGTSQAGSTGTASPSASPTASSYAPPSAEVSPEPVVSTAPAIRTAPQEAKPPAPPAPRPVAPAPAPAPPPAAQEYPTSGRACEDGLESVDELGALGTDCDTARRVATAVDTKIVLLGEVPLEPFMAVDGWVCIKDRPSFEEYVYIECNRGDSRMESVTFGWGT